MNNWKLLYILEKPPSLTLAYLHPFDKRFSSCYPFNWIVPKWFFKLSRHKHFYNLLYINFLNSKKINKQLHNFLVIIRKLTWGKNLK